MEDMKKLNDRMAADSWIEFEKKNPESAWRLKQNARANGLKKVIRKKSDGSTYECYIPIDDPETNLAKMQAELKRLENMPTVEDFVSDMRTQGSTLSNEQLVQMYIDTYYGEDFEGGM